MYERQLRQSGLACVIKGHTIIRIRTDIVCTQAKDDSAHGTFMIGSALNWTYVYIGY